MANSFIKKNDLKQALYWYEKALSEHRDPEIVKKHKEVEKQVKELEKKAYIDPEIAEQEKGKGNEMFKKGRSKKSGKSTRIL